MLTLGMTFKVCICVLTIFPSKMSKLIYDK